MTNDKTPMSKYDFTTLDAAIVIAIATSNGPLSFTTMFAGTVAEEAQKAADAENISRPAWQERTAVRMVDRRLQALRKAGRIQYVRKPEGWMLVPAAGANGHLTRAHLIAIAKDCAARDPQRHDYTRGARGEKWIPHDWVIKAMEAALAAQQNKETPL